MMGSAFRAFIWFFIFNSFHKQTTVWLMKFFSQWGESDEIFICPRWMLELEWFARLNQRDQAVMLSSILWWVMKNDCRRCSTDGSARTHFRLRILIESNRNSHIFKALCAFVVNRIFLPLSVSFHIILHFPKLSSVILCPRFYSHFSCSTTHGCRCLWHLFADLIRGKQLFGFYKSRDSSLCQHCPHNAINKQNTNSTYSRITLNALMCEFNSHYISQIHDKCTVRCFPIRHSALWKVARWENGATHDIDMEPISMFHASRQGAN